jgi:hypothetical protein
MTKEGLDECQAQLNSWQQYCSAQQYAAAGGCKLVGGVAVQAVSDTGDVSMLIVGDGCCMLHCQEAVRAAAPNAYCVSTGQPKLRPSLVRHAAAVAAAIAAAAPSSGCA